jgi:Cys-rich protein (TIGR01571 family)
MMSTDNNSMMKNLDQHPLDTPLLTTTSPTVDPNMSGYWESHLFDSYKFLSWYDICIGTFYPCVIFGRNAETLGYDNDKSCTNYCLLCICPLSCNCFIHAPVRAEIRRRYNIDESSLTEMCLTCCCNRCALLQEYVQLKQARSD